MPHVIAIPPHLNPSTPLTPFNLPTLHALSSTTTLHKALTADFRTWGWPSAYLDISAASGSSSPIHVQNTDARRIDGPGTQSSRTARQRWYRKYQTAARKYDYTRRLFSIWEREHGRRIRERDAALRPAHAEKRLRTLNKKFEDWMNMENEYDWHDHKAEEMLRCGRVRKRREGQGRVADPVSDEEESLEGDLVERLGLWGWVKGFAGMRKEEGVERQTSRQER